MGYDIYEQLVNKSIEAFLLGLEIYNKPTVKYRIEGFSFLIVNAWELMLKAKMIREGKSIYYQDASNRTLSVTDAIKDVYPNKTQPLRINLEKIITLRNTSTHFITEDYETVYAPLFQANVLSYCEQLQKFHKRDITQHIAQNFLTLSATMEPLTNEQIKIKYPPEVANKLIFQKSDIEVTASLHPSDRFSIPIKHNFYQVKSKSDADFTFVIDKEGEVPINPMIRLKDPSESHKFSHDNLVIEINNRLKKQKINFRYFSGKNEKRIFNGYVLGLFIDFYGMKSEEKYAYKHVIGQSSQYTYSQHAAEFIVKEIKNDPQNIVDQLKKAKKNR